MCISRVFTVENICDTRELTCDYCELEEVNRLAGLLLSSLASASLILYGEGSKHHESDINTLKTQLVDTLQLKTNIPVGLTAIKYCIEKFASPTPSTLSKIGNFISNSTPLTSLPVHIQVLYFTSLHLT